MTQSSPESKPGSLTRRHALKVLAATTGAMVLSNLPQEWKTPIVEVGMLPAHAQGASGPPPQVSQLGGYFFPPSPCTVELHFLYNDPLGQVGNASIVMGTFNQNISFGGPVVGPGTINGTGFIGTIFYPFNTSFCPRNQVNASVQLMVTGRYSNVTNGLINFVVD